MQFENFFKKITRDQFLSDYWDKAYYFEKGSFDPVDALFSWEQMNDLINRSKLWNASFMEMAVDGNVLPSEQYCQPGRDRRGANVLVPDPERVRFLMSKGASLVLDFIEGIHPSIQDATRFIERLTGTHASCNAYCSWKSVQAYHSHFDTMCVFAIQIEGEKTWNIYRGRVNEAIDVPRVRPGDFSREQHNQQKGEVMQQIVMRPGDVLYLPRGLYHDAMTTDTASLHLSFGATYVDGHSSLNMLTPYLHQDEFFRKRIPHFDDGDDLANYITELGKKVAEHMARPEFHNHVRGYLMAQVADKVVRHNLPDRTPDIYFMVTRRPVKLARRGQAATLSGEGFSLDIAKEDYAVVEKIVGSEEIWLSDLRAAFPDRVPQFEALLGALAKHGVIWRLRG
ncbi:MAG: hypothetical protein JJ959_14170 [Nisaea sp.]|uniref:JmjC domain-containing protein n=1 Tax=Nisaea sp. TaxID=2024842 RepID=UPI001B1A2A76|nr:cupin domain-containing protein [Nisaea sp.]MBO6561684.1 hypothetical protein [Nisaea sp.]